MKKTIVIDYLKKMPVDLKPDGLNWLMRIFSARKPQNRDSQEGLILQGGLA